MIYFTTTDGDSVLFIEQGNLDRLRAGKPMHTPDKKFLILYTPDLDWTQGQIQNHLSENGCAMSPDELDKIYQDGLKRKEIRR